MTETAVTPCDLSRRGSTDRHPPDVAILTYHKVSPRVELGINSVSPGRYASHLDALQEFGSADASQSELLEMVLDGVPPQPRVHVTFDDAYVDFGEHAWPLCQRLGVRPTVFVIAGYTGRKSNWDLSFPPRQHLDWLELRRLAHEGVSIGAHSMRHPFLTRVSWARAASEIGDCKGMIEDRLGAPVDAFAYPYGAHAPWLADIVAQAGYTLAFTMDPRRPVAPSGRFALPRVGVYSFDGRRTLAAKLGCRGPRAWRLQCRKNLWIHRCSYGNLILRG